MGLFSIEIKRKPKKKVATKKVVRRKPVVKKQIRRVTRKPSKRVIKQHGTKKVIRNVTKYSKYKLTTKPQRKLRKDEREVYIKCMVPGFDSLLKKGIPGGNSVLVEGSAGAGKTIFTLQLAYNNAIAGKRYYICLLKNQKED